MEELKGIKVETDLKITGPHSDIEDYPVQEGWIVVDLGAHKGWVSLVYAKKMNDNGRIIAVEIDRDNYNDLIRNLTLNNCKIVFPFLAGISDKTGTSTLNVSFSTRGHSLENLNPPITAFKARIEVYVVSWDVLVDIFHIENVDYCKCNIEGGEDKFLNGIHKVFPKRLAIQFHQNEKVVKEILKSKGYFYEDHVGDFIYAWKEEVKK